MKKIYLAGPSVFRKDALAYGLVQKELCASRGVEGLYPMDNVVNPQDSDAAFQIYIGDCTMVEASDAVVADVSPFRGPSCDVGTAVEIGMAVGLGIPIFAYSNDRRNYEDKVRSMSKPDGMSIEDFQLEDNLMVSCSCMETFSSFEAALDAAVEYIKND